MMENQVGGKELRRYSTPHDLSALLSLGYGFWTGARRPILFYEDMRYDMTINEISLFRVSKQTSE
jgi:hypothetical protein